MEAIALISGGIDSAVSSLIASERGMRPALALTFDYGQKAAKREIEAASYLASILNTRHLVVELPFFKEIGGSSLTSGEALPNLLPSELDGERGAAASKAVWVPNRNGVFISIAAAFAEGMGASYIIAGLNREEGERFPDNSRGFVEAMEHLLSYSTLTRPRLFSGVIDMDKEEIFKEALRLGLEVRNLWFCYDGGDVWCGRCESCARTVRAMERLGILERYAPLFRGDAF